MLVHAAGIGRTMRCSHLRRKRIGIELECLPVRETSGGAVPFEGPDGIETVLRRLSTFPCYQEVVEEGQSFKFLIILRREVP